MRTRGRYADAAGLRRGASGLALVVALSTAGCARAPYLVTSRAIDVGLGIRLCLAVDPRDPHGVWWWEAGASGCTSRSTGPGIFHPDQAAVSRTGSPEVTAIAFRLGTHSLTRPWLPVRLTIEHDRMRSLDTGSEVALHRRNDLDVRPDYPDPASGREKPPRR
jgi:hypothetical protein